MEKEIKLTEKDLKILGIIKKHGTFITPTHIGMKLHQPYNTASSYCSSTLKKLMNEGMIMRAKIDGKVFYRIKNNA